MSAPEAISEVFACATRPLHSAGVRVRSPRSVALALRLIVAAGTAADYIPGSHFPRLLSGMQDGSHHPGSKQ